MPFVKLDTNILNSTLWIDRICREVFITALLMAELCETHEPMDQFKARSLEKTGWVVPPGWYGFVHSSGVGIIKRAIIDDEELGMLALERLGEPEECSRSSDFDGRRLVRVDGGFIVLNYMKYRDRDYTAAERQRRLRERRRNAVTRDAVTVTRDITHAEAEAEVPPKPPVQSRSRSASASPRKAEKLFPTTVEALRIAAIFNRSRSTGWSEKEVKAFRKAKPDPDDITLVERCYASNRRKENNICRRDLLTLLNNWQGEVDRARDWCGKHPLKADKPKPHAPVDKPESEEEIKRRLKSLEEGRRQLEALGLRRKKDK